MGYGWLRYFDKEVRLHQMTSSKEEILNEYYESIYTKYLFGKSIQSRGIKYFESILERKWEPKRILKNVLEVGSGNGEHFPYVAHYPSESYIALDIRKNNINLEELNLPIEFRRVIKFVQGDVHKLEFEEDHFDRVISTCIFHHLDDPMQALAEIRRVTKPSGEINIAMPTDPGIANQVVKKFVSYPRMRKFTNFDPRLIYALEHRNHIGGLITLIKHVFDSDSLSLDYYPFRIKSWNLNLAVVARIKKKN